MTTRLPAGHRIRPSMAGLEPLLRKIRRVPPFVLDSTLALAILAVGVIDLALWEPVSGYPSGFHAGVLAFVLMSVAAAALALSRTKLWLVVAVSVAIWGIGLVDRSTFVGGIGGILESAVLLFFVAEQWSMRGAIA